MQFLTLYTPAAAPGGPPDAEHMARMGKLMEDMFKAGVLVATGGIMSRNTGMKITRRNGTFAVEEGAVAGSSLMPAAGFAPANQHSRGIGEARQSVPRHRRRRRIGDYPGYGRTSSAILRSCSIPSLAMMAVSPGRCPNSLV